MTQLIGNAAPSRAIDQPISGSPLPVGVPTSLQRKDDGGFAQRVQQRWSEAAQDLSVARRSYWTNLAFYLGQQWVWWSKSRNMLMPYPRQVAPLGEGRVRGIFNRFGPNVLSVLNRLSRSELQFEVPPSSPADNVYLGAQTAEKLLEAKRIDDGWEGVRHDALLACMLGGTSAVAVEWDGQAGRQLPDRDDFSGRFVGTGDATVRARNINEFTIQPNVRRAEDALWWISGVAIPTDEAVVELGLNWLPRPDAYTANVPLYDMLLDGSNRARGRNLCLILTYYERPSKGRAGQYGIVVNGVTVLREDWPFPFDDLNLTTFRQKRIDGKALGATYLDDAVPVQTAYNFSRSILQEHMKLAGNARLVVPFGAIDEEELHGAAGDVIHWSPDGSGAAPQYLSPPNLPRWVSAEPEVLAAELDDIMHTHAINRGVGFSRASGQALSFLAEQDDSALGQMVMEQKLGWARVATQVLKLYGAKASETRIAKITIAPGIVDQVRWTGRELQGQYDVHVPLEAVTPRNAAARMQNAKDLWDRKIITDARKYAKMSGLPPEQFGQLLDPDAEKANRENYRMMMGVPEIPDDFDDHAVHIAEHNDRLRKTDSYKYAGRVVQSIVDDHIKYHENKAANEFAKQTKLAEMSPGGARVPQANAPTGSDVPQSEQEMTGRLGMLASLGVNPGQAGMGAPTAAAAAPTAPMPSPSDGSAAGV